MLKLYYKSFVIFDYVLGIWFVLFARHETW